MELEHKFMIGGVGSNVLAELSMSCKSTYLRSLAPAFV